MKYEIIIVDSGDDRTKEYIEHISIEKRKLIKYKKIKRCTNRSLLRNQGAKIACGKLLIFLDNDMLVSPDFIEKNITLHSNDDKAIILGKRNSLTEFDINLFGKNNLINNFNKLFNYPAIRDDRELYLDDINLTTETAEKPWRFLFSHSFSISKRTFLEIGGFDKHFGNKWGCEDLELGFRLYNKNCRFVLTNEIISFHQPHFIQSKTEQNESFTNNDLFIKKHPYADVELDLSLYRFFQEDYLELKSIKAITNFSYIRKFHDYDYILGFIKDVKDKTVWPNNCLLGTHIPEYKKCNKIIVLKTINKMNYRIKLSILSEAFRISNNVWFEKENDKIQSEKQLLDLYENFKRIGVEVIVSEENDFYKVILKNRIKKKYLALFLCDISCYEKRLVYLYMAEKLRKNDWKINIVDLRRKENEQGEDFILDTTNKSFDDYSYWNDSSIISSLNNKVEKIYSPISGKESFVVDDIDFPYSIYEQNFFSGTNRLDKTIFDMFAINAACEKINEYKKLRSQKIETEFDLCTFMMNGYYEDGVDVILEAIKNNKNIKLGIKIPNYDEVILNCYPGHNEPSKKYKCSSLLDKKRNEEYLLKSKILEMGLFENVKIIKKNMTIFEIFEFIMKGKSFVLLNRGLSIHFLIYASIFLNKSPIITEHSILDERLKKYCLCVKTNESCYATEKHIAISGENIMRLAQKINLSSFQEIIKKLDSKIINNNSSTEVSNVCKDYLNRMIEFLINF